MTMAWPFLLGEEGVTVPLGREFRYKLSSSEGTTVLCSCAVRSFRPCEEETSEENSTKIAKKNTKTERAIYWNRNRNKVEREREREIWGFW